MRAPTRTPAQALVVTSHPRRPRSHRTRKIATAASTSTSPNGGMKMPAPRQVTTPATPAATRLPASGDAAWCSAFCIVIISVSDRPSSSTSRRPQGRLDRLVCSYALVLSDHSDAGSMRPTSQVLLRGPRIHSLPSASGGFAPCVTHAPSGHAAVGRGRRRTVLAGRRGRCRDLDGPGVRVELLERHPGSPCRALGLESRRRSDSAGVLLGSQHNLRDRWRRQGGGRIVRVARHGEPPSPRSVASTQVGLPVEPGHGFRSASSARSGRCGSSWVRPRGVAST